MTPFIKQCSEYAQGKLSEEETEQLWAQTIRDKEKAELLEIELMLKEYFRERKKGD